MKRAAYSADQYRLLRTDELHEVDIARNFLRAGRTSSQMRKMHLKIATTRGIEFASGNDARLSIPIRPMKGGFWNGGPPGGEPKAMMPPDKAEGWMSWRFFFAFLPYSRTPFDAISQGVRTHVEKAQFIGGGRIVGDGQPHASGCW
jgi:hypothetical protein